eukprot:gene7457-7667_t
MAIGELSLHYTSSLSMGTPGSEMFEGTSIDARDSKLFERLSGVQELLRMKFNPEEAVASWRQQSGMRTSSRQCMHPAQKLRQQQSVEQLCSWDAPRQQMPWPQQPGAAGCSGSSCMCQTCAPAAVRAGVVVQGLRDVTKELLMWGPSGLFGLLGDADGSAGAAAVAGTGAVAVEAGLSGCGTDSRHHAAAAAGDGKVCWRKAVDAAQLTLQQQDSFWKLHQQLQLRHYEAHRRRQQLLASLLKHCAGAGCTAVADHKTVIKGMADLAVTSDLADALQQTLEDDLRALDKLFEHLLGEQDNSITLGSKPAVLYSAAPPDLLSCQPPELKVLESIAVTGPGFWKSFGWLRILEIIGLAWILEVFQLLALEKH